MINEQYITLPEDISIKDRYDAKAKAVVAIDRIQLGVAMYRRAGFQKQLGLPLAESTQYWYENKYDPNSNNPAMKS